MASLRAATALGAVLGCAIAAIDIGAARAQEPDAYRAALEEGRQEQKKKNYAAAAKRFQEAAHLAQDGAAIRKKALELRLSAARAGHLNDEAARSKTLLARDSLLRERLRNPQVPAKLRAAQLEQLEQAARDYGKDKDPARAAWARAVRARVQAWSGDPKAALDQARKLADAAQPTWVQQAALEAAHHAAKAEGDSEQEARYALQLDALAHAGMPAEQRRYARSKRVAQACVRYEAKAGSGKCAHLAKELTGDWSFPDFSQEPVRKALSPSDLTPVHAQYLPLVEDCVRTAAKKREDQPLFEDGEVTIGWTVDERGRAQDPEIKPKRYEAPLGSCVRERLSWFRYPRSRGERLTVSIPYQLSVR